MKAIKLFLVLFCTSYLTIFSQDSLKFDFALESWNDIVNNINGGIKKGTVYKGLFAFDPTLSYGSIGFKGSFCYETGKSPTKELVGDFQVLSNIDTDTDIDFFVFESYFFYFLEKLKIKAGIINMNEEFIFCENGADLLINSSFGIPSHISSNSPVSVYPITSLGTDFIYEINNKNKIKLGIYDGFPKTLTQANLRTGIHFNDGIFTISEYERLIKNFDFKFGFFQHSGTFKIKNDIEQILAHNGFYSIICGNILQANKQQLHAFFQFSHSLYNASNHNFYLGGGLSLLLNSENETINQIIFGIAHAGKNRFANGETVYELSYVKQLGKFIFIQPDIQYIVNPSGYVKPLPNALTLNIRLLAMFKH